MGEQSCQHTVGIVTYGAPASRLSLLIKQELPGHPDKSNTYLLEDCSSSSPALPCSSLQLICKRQVAAGTLVQRLLRWFSSQHTVEVVLQTGFSVASGPCKLQDAVAVYTVHEWVHDIMPHCRRSFVGACTRSNGILHISKLKDHTRRS